MNNVSLLDGCQTASWSQPGLPLKVVDPVASLILVVQHVTMLKVSKVSDPILLMLTPNLNHFLLAFLVKSHCNIVVFKCPVIDPSVRHWHVLEGVNDLNKMSLLFLSSLNFKRCHVNSQQQIHGFHCWTKRPAHLMKQFSSTEIVSTATALLAVVAESSRVFHAVDSAALQVAHRCTPAPHGTPATPAALPTHSFGDVDPCLDSDLRTPCQMQIGATV